MYRFIAVIFSVFMVLGLLGPSGASAAPVAAPIVQEAREAPLMGPHKTHTVSFSVSGCYATARISRVGFTTVRVIGTSYCHSGHNHNTLAWVQRSGGGYSQNSITSSNGVVSVSTTLYGSGYGYHIFGSQVCDGSGCRYSGTYGRNV